MKESALVEINLTKPIEHWGNLIDLLERNHEKMSPIQAIDLCAEIKAFGDELDRRMKYLQSGTYVENRDYLRDTQESYVCLSAIMDSLESALGMSKA